MTVLLGVATLGLVPVPFQSASDSCEREGHGENKAIRDQAGCVPLAIASSAAADAENRRSQHDPRGVASEVSPCTASGNISAPTGDKLVGLSTTARA